MAKRKRHNASLPVSLPGEFFVVLWDRSRETFILLVDDEDRSSFVLGSDVVKAAAHFKGWKCYDLGCRALDRAREFGVVQAIPAEDRIINLIDRRKSKTTAFDQKEESYAHLPTIA